MPKHNRSQRNYALRYFFGLLLVVVVFVAGPVASYAANAVAMVTDLVGKGVIIEEGKEKPCEILSYLPPGAEIRIDQGAKLTLVYFKSSKEYSFSGKATIQINSGGPSVLSGSNPQSRSLALVKKTGLSPSGKKGYRAATIVLRSMGIMKKLRLITPKNTKILDARPLFRWEPLEKDIQYRFILTDESGRTVVETLVNDTAFQTPSQVHIKENVLYTWQVEARLASGSVYKSSADFTLLEKAKREKVKKLRPAANASFSERVVFAAALDQMDLRDEATRHWKVLSSERPNDPELKARAKR